LFLSLYVFVVAVGLASCAVATAEPSGIASADSSPVNATLDLESAAAYSSTQRGSALVVWQAGRELLAQGQNGFDLSGPHALASGSNSFACAIAIAAQDANLLRLDEPVSDTITEWRSDPRKARVTIRHLLSFTSGLPANIGGGAQINTTQQALEASLTAQPGVRYTYGNLHLMVLGELLRRKTGIQPEAYLLERVLKPIGLSSIRWDRDAGGNALLAGGAHITARDWLRFGQLMLQAGRWNNQVVLSSAGLAECLKGSSTLAMYGLTWWLNVPLAGTLDALDVVPRQALGLPNTDNPEGFAPQAPRDLFMAAGAGNQRLYIVPSLQLLVLRFGEGGDWNDARFLERLLKQGR
jgi:CubicO group peptidase (beta-lactamase class C family)